MLRWADLLSQRKLDKIAARAGGNASHKGRVAQQRRSCLLSSCEEMPVIAATISVI
jgi:hypothetical protein